MIARKVPADVDLVVVARSSDASVGTYHNAILIHFVGATTPRVAADIRAAARRLAAHEKLLFFGVIELTSAPPEEEARRALIRFFEEHRGRLAGMLVTHFADGFRGAVIRAVVSGVVHLAPGLRFDFPRRIVGSLEEAAALAESFSPNLERAELLRAFHELAAERAMR